MLQPNRRVALAAALLVLAAAAPGWRGELVPVEHEDVLAASRAAPPSTVFGVARDGAVPGERWHAQYAGSGVAAALHDAGMGAGLTRVLPPRFAAHLAPGAEHADGYFRVEARVHWPWWRSGAGVAWGDAPQ